MKRENRKEEQDEQEHEQGKQARIGKICWLMPLLTFDILTGVQLVVQVVVLVRTNEGVSENFNLKQKQNPNLVLVAKVAMLPV